VNGIRQNNSRSGTDDSLTIVYLPFVREGENFVNAIMQFSMTQLDTNWRGLCDWQYGELGYDSLPPNTTRWNAREAFFTFASLDRAVFGHEEFEVTDGQIFFRNQTDTFDVTIESASYSGNNRGLRNADGWQTCYEFVVCRRVVQGTPARNNTQPAPECQEISWCESSWEIDDGSGGDNGWWPGGDQGGGGSNYIPPPQPPCPPTQSRGLNATPGCPPRGWNPGGGGGPFNIEPIDSILKKLSIFMNRFSDSIYSISLNTRSEYAFTIIDFNNNIFDTMHVRTDGSGVTVNPNINVYGGRRLRGIWHSHIVDSPHVITDTTARSGPSGDDVGNLFDIVNRQPPVPIFTECGNVRFALIVTDPQKASIWFRVPGNGPLALYNRLLQLVWGDPRSSTNEFQQVTIEKLLLILGSSGNSGISLYKSNNAEKTTYSKLNP
jgi:hypothetical protein